MTSGDGAIRLFVSFPEDLVDRPMIYEIVKRFDVVPTSAGRTWKPTRAG